MMARKRHAPTELNPTGIYMPPPARPEPPSGLRILIVAAAILGLVIAALVAASQLTGPR